MTRKKLKLKNDIEPYWDLVKRIIEESDIVLEILDARMVDLSRNEQLESIIKEVNRPMIYVINKSDLVSKEHLKKQVEKLKDDKKDVVFISTLKKGNTKILMYAIKKLFKKHGKHQKKDLDPFKKTQYRETKANIIVGVLGYPNVGKSSIINSLAHKKKTKVSKKAGTTHGIQWIRVNEEIKLIDSPGVIPLKQDDELRYALISAREADKLKNPEVVADALIKLFLKNNLKKFSEFYNIQIKEKNSEKILEQLADKNKHLIKGRNYDLNRTAKMMIRDWQHGKLIL